MRAIGDKVRVWIETREGHMMEVDAISVSMSEYMDWSSGIQTEITLAVIGSPKWVSSDGVRDRLLEYKLRGEWRCEYCGRPNSRANEVCQSCGSVRSFIYG